MATPPPPATTIKFQSADGEIVEALPAVARVSVLLRTQLEDSLALQTTPTSESAPHPVSLNGHILKLVFEWAAHHLEDVPLLNQLREDRRLRENERWDADFCRRLSREELFALANAAEQLDILGLSEVICKDIAGRIKGMNATQIRAFFEAPDDNTAEEKKEIQEETSAISPLNWFREF